MMFIKKRRGMIAPGMGMGWEDSLRIARRKTEFMVRYLRARRTGDRLRGFYRRRHLEAMRRAI